MDYKISKYDIILRQADFDLDETLDCGQAFRWEKVSSSGGVKTYCGHYLNNPLKISQQGDIFIFHNTTEDDFLNLWASYFDLYTDYGKLKARFCADKTMKEAIGYAGGIRLLRQDKWEALCSFIISQNNNIPRIKGIISRLCKHYGGFPTYGDLAKETEESLGFLRSGFRAKYLIDAATKLDRGELDLEEISKSEINEARKSLMQIKGVGPKVAECALLYGMYRVEAFPMDVWIKRVMKDYYPEGLPDCVKGFEGIAQQYLFHYIRTANANNSLAD